MSTPLEHALPATQAWIAARFPAAVPVLQDPDLRIWDLPHPTLGHAALTLAHDPEPPISGDTLTLAVPLRLPPPRTPEDILALLNAAEFLPPGVAIANIAVDHDSLDLGLLAKIPLDPLPDPAALDRLLARLRDAKTFLEA